MRKLSILLFFLLVPFCMSAQTEDIEFLNSSDGLSNSSVNVVFQDSRGLMWFGTWDGLNSWNGRNFSVWKYSAGDPHSISGNVVRDIREDSGGRLWVCTDRGVDRFDPATGRFERFFSEKSYTQGGEQPFSMYLDSKGVYVFVDRSGLYSLAGGRFGKLLDSDLNVRRFRMDGDVPVFLDKGGNIYRGDTQVLSDPVLDRFKGNNDCFDDGTIMYEARGDGLHAGGVTLLGGVPVLSVFKGTQDILWAGTDMRGVAMMKPGGDIFFTTRDVFGGSAVRCFSEDAESGRMIVGTKGSGLYFFSSDGGIARHVTAGERLLSNSVYCISDDGQTLWIGTDGTGLNYIEKPGMDIRRLEVPDSLRAMIPSSVYDILPRGRDTLWLGTAGGGLMRITLKGHTMVSARRYDASVLGSNVVYSVIDGKDSTLWIGTRGGGVRRLHLDDDTVEAIPSEYDVLSLLLGDDGSVWAGTSAGLELIGAQGLRRRYTERDGLPNNTIHGIVPDDYGSLWISTNRGLALLDAKTGEIISFDTKDGLQDNEFSDGAYYRSPTSGLIWFGGIRGFSRLDPRQSHDSGYFPPLLLDSFHLENEPAPLQEHLRGGTLTLRHGPGSFSFRFIPLDYLNSRRCELQYKLSGFNADWVRLGTSSTIVFSNLRPGRYTLRVKCSSSSRQWLEEGYVLPIRILPRWWESPVAFFFYILLIVGILQAVVKFFRDREEARKTQEITRARLKFYSDMGYEFSNALTLMQGPGERLQKGRLSSDQRQYLETIEAGSDRMHTLVKQLIAAVDDIPVPTVPAQRAVRRENDSLQPEMLQDADLLIVGDDAGIRAFIGALMSYRFNIIESQSGNDAIGKMQASSPSLVICDMRLGDMDGMEFVTRVRAERILRHIPVIMLSASDSVDRHIEALEKGADAYIPKPINPRYLTAVSESLLGRGKVNREYGGSARASVQELARKTVKNEDKALIVTVSDIIIRNIDNSALSAEDVAREAALSKMQLYRKLKSLVGMSPTEFIRSIRLENALKLLKTSNKTVQEIMYACGFANKAYFYREFQKKYGVTPKQYRDRQQR